MKSSIRQPKGFVPKSRGAQLPQEYAQYAENIDLRQVGWVPWRQPAYLLDFDRCTRSAHLRHCCWTLSDKARTRYLTTEGHGGYTYRSRPGEYPDVTLDMCSDVWERLGVPIPDIPEVNVLDTDQQCDMMTEQRAYKLVYVVEHEQGAGSMPSDPVEVHSKQSVVVGLPTRVDPAWGVTSIQIYRLAATWNVEQGLMDFSGDFNPGFADIGTQSHYFLVGEVPIGTSEFIDTGALPTQMLTTDDYYPPAKGLQVMGETASGSLVGFEGQNVWFSERNAYWAWPARARHNFPDPICCLGVCADSVIVITQTRAYVIEDTAECADATCRPVLETKETFRYCGTGDCLRVLNGLIYTTTKGLFHTRTDGSTVNLTQNAFDQDSWLRADPGRMRLGMGYDHVFLSNSMETWALMLLFDEFGSLPEHVSKLSIVPDAWLTDEYGALFYILNDKAYEFNAGDDFMIMTWQQSEQTLTQRSRASVFRADYADKKKHHGNHIMIYRDQQVQGDSVRANQVVRFRSALGECYAVRVRGDCPMLGVHYGPGIAHLNNQ